MSRIENLRIIHHFKDNVSNDIHGIYECDFNGEKTVFVRHGMEIGIVSFLIGQPLRKCITPVSESAATDIANEVEFKLMIEKGGE